MDRSTTPMNMKDYWKAGYTFRRYYIDQFFFKEIERIPPGSRVLDLGGNRIHKRGQFDIERYDIKTVYANYSRAKCPHVQADARYLPFRESCFNVVICAEVLEHVRSPGAVLQEVYQVLQPEGIFLATVPFLYRIHGDPEDFGRYTDHYWMVTLQDIGFTVVQIERQGLFFSVWVDFLKQYLSEGNPGRFGRAIGCRLIPRFQRWAMTRDRRDSVKAHPFLRSFTTGFGIVALKG